MHLIQQNQFAFVINFSTTTAFIRTVDSWKLAIDKGEKVMCAFLDLQDRSRYSSGQDASVRCTRNSSGVDEELSV